MTLLTSLYIAYIQSRKIHIALIYPLSLLASSLVGYYSYEARPLMLSLFTGSLFVFMYFRYLTHRDVSLLYVVISQFLFSFSIGLQPLVLIISCFVGALCYERG